MGLTNNFLVYILPYLFNFFYAILFISFFKKIPSSIEESAKIDGANDFTIFTKIIFPMSKSVIITILLYNGVMHWTNWFDSVYFTSNDKLMTLPAFLWKVLNEAKAAQFKARFLGLSSSAVTLVGIKLSTVVLSALPIFIIYPLLRRYLVGGIVLGSLKE